MLLTSVSYIEIPRKRTKIKKTSKELNIGAILRIAEIIVLHKHIFKY